MHKYPVNELPCVAPRMRAAKYTRMSTEHQRYSTANQDEKIDEYAAGRNIDIVRTYSDDGISGLSIKRRQGLKDLIRDAESNTADFEIILVYDVSRWGRFQDSDESAYWEFRCRQAGVQVAYCAEMFENDGSPLATLFKGMKRTMAGEYSRELSVKVFAGQCRLAAMGYKQGGGHPGFGLRRTLVDPNGKIKSVLARGEWKSLQTDHVILTHGPREEVETVVAIFDWFVNEGLGEGKICTRLNNMKIKNGVGAPWVISGIHFLLTNEKYIGNYIFNKQSFKLKLKHVKNAPELWVRKDGAFEAIVDPSIFMKAQQRIDARPRPRPRQHFIDMLQQLFNKHGYLHSKLIDSTEGMPSSSSYIARFGSILAAYKAVGYRPKRGQLPLTINSVINRVFPEVTREVDAQFGEVDNDWATQDARNLAMAAVYLAKLFENEPALAVLKTRCPDLLRKLEVSVIAH